MNVNIYIFAPVRGGRQTSTHSSTTRYGALSRNCSVPEAKKSPKLLEIILSLCSRPYLGITSTWSCLAVCVWVPVLPERVDTMSKLASTMLYRMSYRCVVFAIHFAQEICIQKRTEWHRLNRISCAFVPHGRGTFYVVEMAGWQSRMHIKFNSKEDQGKIVSFFRSLSRIIARTLFVTIVLPYGNHEL